MFLVMFFSWPFAVFFLYFFCELLSFAAKTFLFPVSYFLLPQAFFFCGDFSLFGYEHFSFAMENSSLLWPISFLFTSSFLMPQGFFFYEELFFMPWPICLFTARIFSFVGSFFLLPWLLWATVEKGLLNWEFYHAILMRIKD